MSKSYQKLSQLQRTLFFFLRDSFANNIFCSAFSDSFGAGRLFPEEYER